MKLESLIKRHSRTGPMNEFHGFHGRGGSVETKRQPTPPGNQGGAGLGLVYVAADGSPWPKDTVPAFTFHAFLRSREKGDRDSNFGKKEGSFFSREEFKSLIRLRGI